MKSASFNVESGWNWKIEVQSTIKLSTLKDAAPTSTLTLASLPTPPYEETPTSHRLISAGVVRHSSLITRRTVRGHLGSSHCEVLPRLPYSLIQLLAISINSLLAVSINSLLSSLAASINAAAAAGRRYSNWRSPTRERQAGPVCLLGHRHKLRVIWGPVQQRSKTWTSMLAERK